MVKSLWHHVKAINTESEWQWIEYVHHLGLLQFGWVDMHPVLGEVVVHDV
jgi:hypothetical protein